MVVLDTCKARFACSKMEVLRARVRPATPSSGSPKTKTLGLISWPESLMTGNDGQWLLMS